MCFNMVVSGNHLVWFCLIKELVNRSFVAQTVPFYSKLFKFTRSGQLILKLKNWGQGYQQYLNKLINTSVSILWRNLVCVFYTKP